MHDDKHKKSELITAAEALDEELTRHARLVHEVCKLSLTSRKSLGRAGELLHEVLASDERLQTAVSGLVGAVTKAREAQQERAEKVQARAKEIEARTAVLKELLESFAALGDAAIDANGKLSEAATALQTGKAQDMAQARHALGELAERAQGLGKDAEEREFEDVARDAEALRQSLLSGLNKLSLLTKKLES